MELDCMLVGEGTAFIFTSEDKGKVRFHCYTDDEEYADVDMDQLLEKSWQDGMALYRKNIREFLLELNHYPLYVHSMSGSGKINIAHDADSSTRFDRENIYHRLTITSEEAFLHYFPKAYQDANNNESVLFSSEKTIKIDETKNDFYFKKFRLNFSDDERNCFFLWVNHDGNGFDFIANFSDHPYQHKSIEIENVE